MKTRIISVVSIAVALSLMAVVPAFAQAGDDQPVNNDQNAAAVTDTSNTAAAVNSTLGARMAARSASTTKANAAGANMQQRINNAQNRGTQEITARIDSLNKLLSRIQSMKNLSASQIASLQATIQGAVTDMTSLQAKIQSDASTTSLMADLKSIAPDYRIYVLIEPQVSILSASDRVNAIVATLTTFQAKIQTRLASTTVTDLAALQADLADMAAKLTDAAKQAQAATAEVSGLKPDNGDKTVMASNLAALKDARSKIQAATKDIQAVYKDAQAVIKGVKGTSDLKTIDSKSSKAASTASASTTTQ